MGCTFFLAQTHVVLSYNSTLEQQNPAESCFLQDRVIYIYIYIYIYSACLHIFLYICVYIYIYCYSCFCCSYDDVGLNSYQHHADVCCRYLIYLALYSYSIRRKAPRYWNFREAPSVCQGILSCSRGPKGSIYCPSKGSGSKNYT